jgi:hypothetical protein
LSARATTSHSWASDSGKGKDSGTRARTRSTRQTR